MFDKLKDLEINFEKNNIKLEKFMHIFFKYNENVNLISKNDAKFLFEKHIYDSLAFNLFYSKYFNNENVKLLDIGTGGGFPAIPISVFFENIDITAVDSTMKKIKFIEFVKQELNLNNIHPVCKRVEELTMKEFDICTSRAMAELRIILEYAVPYLKTGAFFVAYKSIKSDEEIKSAKNAFLKLNSEIIDKIEYSLPLKEENKRVLLIIRKNAPTDNIYPRKNGLISKRPL